MLREHQDPGPSANLLVGPLSGWVGGWGWGWGGGVGGRVGAGTFKLFLNMHSDHSSTVRATNSVDEVIVLGVSKTPCFEETKFCFFQDVGNKHIQEPRSHKGPGVRVA